jgi:hypothetical protein
MSPGNTFETNTGTKTQMVYPDVGNSDRARILRVSRQREFANLRFHMGSVQGVNTVAGLRSQTVRDKSISRKALEKIDRIGAHLENHWSPVEAKTAPITVPAAVSGSDAVRLPEPPSNLAKLPETVIHKSVEAPMLALPNRAKAVSHKLPAQSPMGWASDPTLGEVALLCLQRKEAAAQSRLRAALATKNERTPLAYHQALLLLEICRLQDDMASFDDTVVEYVHWWNDTPPLWEVKPEPRAQSFWHLQGDMQDADSLQLPELDLSQEVKNLTIDCTALLRMDQQAAKALLGWLQRAQLCNYALHMETSSVLVYLQWTVTGMEKFATLRKTF